MRIKNLILGDVKFQFKYGFYFVYIVFTLLYICFLRVLPNSWRDNTATILIFSDPAAMGLFFMGAIVLLEKSQRVINSIAVSPVRVWEYIISKVVSIGIIGTLAGIFIALTVENKNILLTALGTFLGSILFSLLGLIVAARVSSLNRFLVLTIPIEIIAFIPPIAYLLGYNKAFMLLHPGCILIRILSQDTRNIIPLLLLFCIWIGIFFYFAYREIGKMFRQVGGVKL